MTPVDHEKLKEILPSLKPDQEPVYDLSNLSETRLICRRIEINQTIQQLEDERKAIDQELQDSISDFELRRGISQDGFVLSQRTRQTWAYPSELKKQIKAMQTAAQKSGEAVAQLTTYLVASREGD
jgi:hypothetical protein